MSKIKHSKFKNTGILFELLVRQVTADILNNTPDADSKANKILQQFFNEATELGKELKLYQLLIQERAKDSINADRIIETILKARKRISNKRLHEQKYTLIKEIKDTYPLQDFLKGKISNYKLLASVYKLFEEASNNDDYCDAKEVIQSRSFITENLLGNSTIPNREDAEKDKLIEFYKNQEEDLRHLSYKILVESFNTKYSTLDDRQKLLLKEYINNISNTNSLKKYIDSEIPKVQEELQELSNSVDKVVKIKLLETIRQLDKVKKGSTVKDSQVTSLLLSYELIKELKLTTSKSNG